MSIKMDDEVVFRRRSFRGREGHMQQEDANVWDVSTERGLRADDQSLFLNSFHRNPLDSLPDTNFSIDKWEVENEKLLGLLD